jgi:hypothetical protein
MGTAAALDEEAESVVLTDAPAPASSVVRAWLPPGVLVVVAALLSLPRLGVRTLWLDEAYTVGATNELLDTWRHTGVTQALRHHPDPGRHETPLGVRSERVTRWVQHNAPYGHDR